jgi:hypothetical protein
MDWAHIDKGDRKGGVLEARLEKGTSVQRVSSMLGILKKSKAKSLQKTEV